MANSVKFPFGSADVQALTASGAQALTITDNLTIIDGYTVEATAARTLNIATLADSLLTGSKIVVLSQTNGTETTVFGTNMVGATITGVAGTIFSTEFVYDGVNFKQVGAEKQIN